jgi:hypothetical protein
MKISYLQQEIVLFVHFLNDLHLLRINFCFYQIKKLIRLHLNNNSELSLFKIHVTAIHLKYAYIILHKLQGPLWS